MKKLPKTSREKNNQISLPKIIDTEVNLLKFPFFALERKNKKLEVEYRKIVERKNQKIEIIWNVSANPKYGYPGPFDREVYKAIEQIISEILRAKGKIENPIPFSIYDICKRMNIEKYGGREYKKVKEAFTRIKTTSIESKGTFYNKDKKQWVDDIFSLYERVIFKGEKMSDSEIAEENYLFLGSWYLQSLNSFYIKPIDYAYLQSLESKIASRLYEILGVMFYGMRNKKDQGIHLKYSTLCQLLPLIPYKYFSQAERQLNPAHEELKDTGFISNYQWSENGKKDWLIYYWSGERAKEEIRKAKFEGINNINHQDREYLPEPKEEEKKYSEEQVNLINKLVKLNVSKITAENLLKSKDQELIKEWIEAINYTNADDKAAYLVKAIRENWQLPEEYLGKKREEERKEEEEKIEDIKIKQEEEKNKKRQEEIKKIEQIYDSLTLSQQEEIKREAEKRLPDFWKEKLNKGRVKGTTSKFLEAALEEKRREIIKELIESGRIKI